jgi:hemolysin III
MLCNSVAIVCARKVLTTLMHAYEPRRPHSGVERFADGCVHVVGIAAGLLGGILLIALAAGRTQPMQMASVIVYSVALLAMLSASAAYNIFYQTRFRRLFRVCDHSAIFVMIAGTFTPFATALTNAFWVLGFGTTVWSMTIGGIALKVTRPALFERFGIGLYLAQGWLGVLLFGPLATHFTIVTLMALVMGGVLYTVGIIFHLWEALPFHNAIWHVFVLAAAVCHYLAVLDGIVLARVA